jgi:hypothetical protein
MWGNPIGSAGPRIGRSANASSAPGAATVAIAARWPAENPIPGASRVGVRRGKSATGPRGITSRRGELPMFPLRHQIRGSIVFSISAGHAEDPGSIPGRGVFYSGHVACKSLHAKQGNDQRRRLDIASACPRGSPAHPPASPPIRAASDSGRAAARAGRTRQATAHAGGWNF